MPLTIEIIRGVEAHQLRHDIEFLCEWKSLARQTTHVSVFQEPEFVNSWHEAYKRYFEPIFIIGKNESGNIVGLIPLTIDTETEKLMHAGGWHAEYHGWLGDPGVDETFMTQAMMAIKRRFSVSSWHWTYLPPRCNTDWLQNPVLTKNGIYTRTETMKSPLLDLHDEEKLTKILKSKSIKSKINRLKRLGELRIERINSKERVKQLMDQIALLVNFRHEAVHDVAPFETDYLQRDFYLTRSDNLQANHFSVLWMGSKLLAFHYGAIDHATIYIGLTAFDPTASKHSPGVIFLLYLAQLLQQEGIRYIDLTPGGDEYKERFSNAHQTITKPIFYFNKIEKIKSDSKSISSKLLKKSNRRFNIINKKENVDNSHNYVCYGINKKKYEQVMHINNNAVNIQKFADLFLYNNNKHHLKRSAILSHAMQRFSQADILFSLVKDNQLLAHAWTSKTGSKYKRLGTIFDPGKTGAVLDCLDQELRPLKEDHMKSLLPAMLNYAFANDATEAFIYLPNDAPVALVEEMGFTRKNLT